MNELSTELMTHIAIIKMGKDEDPLDIPISQKTMISIVQALENKSTHVIINGNMYYTRDVLVQKIDENYRTKCDHNQFEYVVDTLDRKFQGRNIWKLTRYRETMIKKDHGGNKIKELDTRYCYYDAGKTIYVDKKNFI